MFKDLAGERWNTLHPNLQASHTLPQQARGTVKVIVNGGYPGRLLAKRLSLPEAGEDVAIELSMEGDRHSSTWHRSFNGRPMLTRMRRQRDKVIETAGATEIEYSMTFEPERITYTSATVYVSGVPVWGPRVEAEIVPTENGWHVSVKVLVPVIGLLCHYEGELIPI